jgi:hypothetical protein
MRAVKLDTSMTIRLPYDEKLGIKRLSEAMKMEPSEFMRSLARQALCLARRDGCYTVTETQRK